MIYNSKDIESIRFGDFQILAYVILEPSVIHTLNECVCIYIYIYIISPFVEY